MSIHHAHAVTVAPSGPAVVHRPQGSALDAVDLDGLEHQPQATAGNLDQLIRASTSASPEPRPSEQETAVSVVALRTAPLDEQLRLPLEWEVAPGIPAVPPAPRHLRLVGGGAPSMQPVEAGPPLEWIARIARAIAEVGAGDRPAGQLMRWVERRQLAYLAARGAAVQQHPSSRGRQAQQAAVRAGAKVRSIRVCPIAPGIVETSAVLIGGQRARAIALRFEFVAERWLVTAISLG